MRHELIAADKYIRVPLLRTVGYSEDRISTQSGFPRRNLYIIHYVLSGKGYFNGVPVKKGEGFLLTPDMSSVYFPEPKDPWSYIWFTSNDEAMEYFFECHNPNPSTNIFKYHNIDEIMPIVESLKKQKRMMSTSMYITELFLHIFNLCTNTQNNKKESNTTLYYNFATNYIKSNLHLPLSVESICKTVGITQPYLYRIFKSEAGMSTKQYIMECKLKQSKKLLKESDLVISQIALSVGFSDALNFSKFFSQKTGISPTQYREMHKKNGILPSDS